VPTERVEKLRQEARRCLEARKAADDPAERLRLAARALDLAQLAEALERAAEK
jgi:hypothetical protein